MSKRWWMLLEILVIAVVIHVAEASLNVDGWRPAITIGLVYFAANMMGWAQPRVVR